MKPASFLSQAAVATFVLSGALLHAAGVTGAVTDRTTGKPAAGDSVALVDPQAGMRELAHTTTDANGRYALNLPGGNPALIRVTHQGASYFIAAPQGGASGDVAVYDVGAKLEGVSIEADIFEVETENGQFHVTERYFVHNTSSPPRTQWSRRGFEVSLPPEAVVASAAAQRPAGLATAVELGRGGIKGHYVFDFPIQPDQGDKDTLFEVEYLLPYKSGSYTFHTGVSLPAQSVGVLLPKTMTLEAAPGTVFQSVPEDPTVQTFVARNAVPGKALAFTISGSGTMPRETPADSGVEPEAASGNQPGGGIGAPIDTPDPLTKYKMWILGGLFLLLTAAAAFLLRRPRGTKSAAEGGNPRSGGAKASVPVSSFSSSSEKAALLITLKEDLFALESEKLSGTLKPEEYIGRKTAMEKVLRKTLNRT